MMMDNLIQSILFRMKWSKLVNEDDEDVYRFGLECLLLKLIHYSSYLFIGFVLRMTIPMLVSAMALMTLRSRSGGYHAKTRFGCYLFSCFVVFLVCMLNKVMFPGWLLVLVVFMVNIVVCCFAPLENENRILDLSEIKEFRKQALSLLGIADVVIITTALMDCIISQWLLNGILIAAILILLEKCKRNIVEHE